MQENQFKIGIFVGLGLILIMASIFFLGADKSVFSSYGRVFTHFSNVQGLYDGSVVSLSGIEIGNVEKIFFEPSSNKLKVQMKIETKYLPRITSGTRAEINTQGALGDKYVHLIPGDAEGEGSSDGATIESTEGNGILDVISSRGKETERVFDIINETHKMIKSLNHENKIGKIVDHLQSTSANLNSASFEMKKFTSTINDDDSQKRLKASLLHFESILSKVDKGEGTLGALINDPALHERLKGILGADQRKSHVRSLLRTSIQGTDK